MKETLLDSDTISLHLKGFASVTNQIEAHYQHFGYLYLSVIFYYEIMHGLLFKDARKQMQSFQIFLKDCRVLPLSMEIANIAADVYAGLRRNNQIIGHTDVLIGSTGLHHNLKVVTNNQAHFVRIPNLELDNWV
ncbi:MAG: type II toxin-antitoxin system VapC family toxin [Saprospiraceae bacterium]